MTRYKIKSSEVGLRLDKFLQSKLPNLSRARIQKMIKNGEVNVGGKAAVPHHFVKVDELVEIKRYKDMKDIEDKGPRNVTQVFRSDCLVTPTFRSDIIIKETADYLVINKPVGVLVHPDGVHNETTIVDWLLKRCPLIKDVYDRENKTGWLRPGIVHRLDRDVSGLMVIAKNQKMFDYLKDQFKKRQVKKEYLTLVHGSIEREQGEILRPIGRSKRTGLMAAKTDYLSDSGAKNAITGFEVLKRFKNYTLLKINLKTGRTHQIRVHLKSIGHNVVGDILYQTRDVKIKRHKNELCLLFLCATQLGFYDLENKWQEFEIKLPKELQKFLEKVRGVICNS